MPRVEIHYGGILYTVADRSAEEIRREIEVALDSGKVSWLPVNRGEGLPRETRLLIHPGVAVAVGTAQE